MVDAKLPHIKFLVNHMFVGFFKKNDEQLPDWHLFVVVQILSGGMMDYSNPDASRTAPWL